MRPPRPLASVTAIELDGVSKRFGSVTALRDLDMTVEQGEVFGFLGPNGAGKSTTIDLLLDYLRPTEGRVTVLGTDVQADPIAVRERTGILPEGFSTFATMTGRQHLEFAIDARDADADPDAILDRVGLDGAGDRQASGYSKGMAQRLALGMALIGEPDLLILDEPSTGLDPHGVRRMREIVREERDRGATVFFSSHILGQVEAVCDRVAILREGELLAVDTLDGLREAAGFAGQLSVTLDREPDGAVDSVRAVDAVSSVAVDGRTITVGCPDGVKADVIDAARERGAAVENVETADSSLEDLFVAYTEGEA